MRISTINVANMLNNNNATIYHCDHTHHKQSGYCTTLLQRDHCELLPDLFWCLLSVCNVNYNHLFRHDKELEHILKVAVRCILLIVYRVLFPVYCFPVCWGIITSLDPVKLV